MDITGATSKWKIHTITISYLNIVEGRKSVKSQEKREKGPTIKEKDNLIGR